MKKFISFILILFSFISFGFSNGVETGEQSKLDLSSISNKEQSKLDLSSISNKDYFNLINILAHSTYILFDYLC